MQWSTPANGRAPGPGRWWLWCGSCPSSSRFLLYSGGTSPRIQSRRTSASSSIITSPLPCTLPLEPFTSPCCLFSSSIIKSTGLLRPSTCEGRPAGRVVTPAWPMEAWSRHPILLEMATFTADLEVQSLWAQQKSPPIPRLKNLHAKGCVHQKNLSRASHGALSHTGVNHAATPVAVSSTKDRAFQAHVNAKLRIHWAWLSALSSSAGYRFLSRK